jgi:hypothetical protein
MACPGFPPGLVQAEVAPHQFDVLSTIEQLTMTHILDSFYLTVVHVAGAMWFKPPTIHVVDDSGQ